MLFGIVVVDKNGVATNKQLKDVGQLSEIHKKCSSSKTTTAGDYSKITTWEIKEDKNTFYIDLYGKKEGRAGFENKYELPPPVDKVLLFNAFALVKYTLKNKQMCLETLSTGLWKKYYDNIMGGFDDVNSDDENEEDELENVPKKFKTANGYLKDGFVVDNNEEIEVEESDDDSEVVLTIGDESDDDLENADVDEDMSEESADEDIAFEDDDDELAYEEYSESDTDDQ